MPLLLRCVKPPTAHRSSLLPSLLSIYLCIYLLSPPPQVKSLNQAITSSERKAAGHPMAVRLEAQVQLKEAKEVMHGLGPGGDL